MRGQVDFDHAARQHADVDLDLSFATQFPARALHASVHAQAAAGSSAAYAASYVGSSAGSTNGGIRQHPPPALALNSRCVAYADAC